MRTTSLPLIGADKRGWIHQELTEKVIGIFYEVYNELGHGFLESVYEELRMPGKRTVLKPPRQLQRAIKTTRMNEKKSAFIRVNRRKRS